MSCEVDGYNEFESTTRPRARKPHECCACELPIRVGDVYERFVVKWDGEFKCLTRCLRCCAIADALHEQQSHSDSLDYGGVAYALDCGHEWEENFEEPPPAEVARLAFMTVDEAQRELAK